MKNTISSIIFKHGDDDYSIWIPDFSAEEMEKITKLLEKYSTEGYSVRGSKKDLIEELKEII
ncbi:hypothetical protein [Peptoniphilus vaginalis]|uniref:hypothetical protein n=1 Tax=Peptoniphilus vaginalis TaxID=1756987 RepID=UPI0023F6E7C8|nr:hypothetical protein [Peptoniphilus vaginalis]